MAVLREASGLPLWLYLTTCQASPRSRNGFTALSRRIATRAIASRALLWGKRVEPSTYNIASSLFARAIALIYLIAFISFGRQVRGLIGDTGNPAGHANSSREVTRQFGAEAFWRVPTIFWWIHSEYGLLSIAWGGAVVACVAAIGRPHTPGQKGAFVLLFIYYLSIVNGGQIFMGYQWDFLLLEVRIPRHFPEAVVGARLALPLAAVPVDARIGCGQAAQSTIPTWRNLTALALHYETQPLPTPLAWYMMQAASLVPENVHGICVRRWSWACRC